MKQECKDCNKSLEECTCIEDTIEFPKQEIKLEEVFNDDKKENIKKFIDEIQNPSEPNQALKDAAKNHSNQTIRDDSEKSFIEGAKWKQEQDRNVYLNGYVDGSREQAKLMYNQEDLECAWSSSEQNMRFQFSSSAYKGITFKQWLEKFKQEINQEQ
jgi:hypothetical protein